MFRGNSTPPPRGAGWIAQTCLGEPTGQWGAGWKEYVTIWTCIQQSWGAWKRRLRYSLTVCLFKGCGMGPWPVLVSPCFRENVVATCKIGSFLCSLDYLLQKNVLVLFFGNQISKWRSFEKRAIFDLLFTFFSHQEKLQKFLQHISHSHTYTYFAQPIDFICLTNFEKNTNLSDTVSLWYESWWWFLFAPFWNRQ